MANLNAYIQTFAGGEFGDAMSARVAIDAYQASCELMENWFIQAQGPMTRRPSLEYIDSFDNSNLKGVLKRFEFDVGQNYLLVITEGSIDFALNDGRLITDVITASIANGTFSNFTGWSDNSETGSTAGAANGWLTLSCNGPAAAIARTTFTVNEANSRHIITFDVEHGPVNIRIGSSAGAYNYLNATELRRGHHRLEFTPTATGTCHLQFSFAGAESVKLIDNVSLLAGPNFSMPALWLEDDLRGIYTAQDGDRLWMFHRDYLPTLLERRGHYSWSIIYFEPDDGPFDPGEADIQLTPAAKVGQTTIGSSDPVFVSTDNRRLIRITQPGQYKRKVANSGGVFGDAIKVVGVGADRIFSANLSGTFTGTVTLERSNGNQNDFSKVTNFTGTLSVTFNDSYKTADTGKGGTSDIVYDATNDTSDNPKGRLDNTTAFYRWAIYAGEWTSGTVTMELSSDSGSQTGIARVTGYNSETEVDVEVLRPFSRAGASDVWDIGAWSEENEYPNVVTFAHGRLWTFRRRRVWSSVSDDYFSFQDGVEADQSVQLTLRSKSAEGVRWARELDFLCVGTRNEEYVIRSTSPSEPIGPVSAEPSLQGEEGSAGIEAEIGGDSIVFVHRNRRRVMQFSHNPKALSEDSFISVDLNRLNPDACEAGIINAVIQQEPDRRIYATLEDGTVKPALFRREEEIMGWATMSTRGVFEDACVLREADEDVVYFIVRRFIGGEWVRMVERMRSEVQFNPEDLVHLDSMLETPISRPAVSVLPSAIGLGAVTVTAADDAFEAGDVGKVMWIDGGRINVTGFTNSQAITGTIVYPLLGEARSIAGDPDDKIPRLVPGGFWGLATPVSSVTGLDHLEGEEVEIWADLAYAGTATVSDGEVELPYTASRVFVGLGFPSIWISLRLAYGAQKGTAINQNKGVKGMAFLLSDTADCLHYGDAPGKLSKLVALSQPAILGGSPRLFTGEAYRPFNGKTDRDPRIIIAALNPGPATIKAIVPNIQVNE